jgi:hypothetical protein
MFDFAECDSKCVAINIRDLFGQRNLDSVSPSFGGGFRQLCSWFVIDVEHGF